MRGASKWSVLENCKFHPPISFKSHVVTCSAFILQTMILWRSSSPFLFHYSCKPGNHVKIHCRGRCRCVRKYLDFSKKFQIFACWRGRKVSRTSRPCREMHGASGGALKSMFHAGDQPWFSQRR